MEIVKDLIIKAKFDVSQNMPKKVIILVSIFAAIGLAVAIYSLNQEYGFFGSNNFKFSTSNELSIQKLEIKYGFTSINRTSDAILFDTKLDVIFDGNNCWEKKIEYGENDFLIIYDNTHYYQFRQFKMHHSANHDYNFDISLSDSGMYVNILIEGIDGMKFTRKMNPISIARNLKCNVPIEKAGHIYNMKELIDK